MVFSGPPLSRTGCKRKRQSSIENSRSSTHVIREKSGTPIAEPYRGLNDAGLARQRRGVSGGVSGGGSGARSSSAATGWRGQRISAPTALATDLGDGTERTAFTVNVYEVAVGSTALKRTRKSG